MDTLPIVICFVNQPHSFGMFSILNYVVGVLYQYDRDSYAGIRVNFENQGLYYDSEYGPNWWSYYFEPIDLGNIENAKIKRFSKNEFVTISTFVEKYVSRKEANRLILKYIKVRKNIKTKIEKFARKNFKEHHIIGIHYRGTDKYKEAEIVPYELVQQAIQEYIDQHNVQNYKIFLATDEGEFVQFLTNAFPGSVIVYSTLHSNNNKPLHKFSADKYLQGEEALVRFHFALKM